MVAVDEVIRSLVEESQEPVLPRPDSLTVTDLLDLWHGDQDSYGYAHPYIAKAVCRIVKPPSLELLFSEWLYPNLVQAEVPYRAQRLVAAGYRLWRREVEAAG